MTLTRSQTGKTPKKAEYPGYVETPGTFGKPRSRKSLAAQIDGADASGYSTGTDNETPVEKSIRNISDSNQPTVDIHTNGHADGGLLKANGSANGQVKLPKPRIVDGWEVGTDPKIDRSGHKEFGGRYGVSAMMIGFPILMYYMWIGATYYNGGIPRAKENQSYPDFLRDLAGLAYTGAFPSLKACAMYWIFFAFECFLYLYAPGVWTKGKPLPHMNNASLDYYCSGIASFWITNAVALTLHFSGVFPLYVIMDEFGPLMSVAIISGFAVAIIAYASAIARGSQHRMTGDHIYDFFMGAELNPRMFGILDFKMFFEVRLPWYILYLTTLGMCARQYERYGYITGEASLLLLGHFLYANACSKGEELICPTWDMYYEKWGFMLIFWNMAGVPLSYCHCTVYLANHPPSDFVWNKYAIVALHVMYLFVYWVWDTTNGQKNRFRSEQSGGNADRWTFPPLPWAKIKNPKVIMSDAGPILADGWYGYARKIHYTCDLFFALSWGAVTGFKSPFPWFYPVFFACMITHRAVRDIQRCRLKYGPAWLEYEKQVPYLFIPYVF